jgi:hypothetical protein
MKMYNAAVEVATKNTNEDLVDELMDQLAQYHVAIGTSARGWLEARISLPAESLAQACATAAAVVETATGRSAIACEVMTEDEFDARQGFTSEPDVVSSAEAAEILGVTRQRVAQLANEGRLQEVPWSGRSRAFTRSSVAAIAGQERPTGRPRRAQSV